MTLPEPTRPGAWRLGNWKHRIEGKIGIPMLAVWDTILPWSLPDPVPPFFPPSPPPAPFEGYERNETETEASQPNFPVPATGEQGFRVVVLSTQGLKRSAVAPPRSGKRDGVDRGKDDTVHFPFTLPNGYRLFLEYYRDNYLDPKTYVVVVLPERDIRYLLEWEKFGNESDAKANFKGVIEDTLEVLGDQLVGWYSVDEPELFDRTEYYKEKIVRVQEVRQYIRQYEWAWRTTPGNDPGFAAIPSYDRQMELLLPVIVTYSARIFTMRNDRWTQQAERNVPPELRFTFFLGREFADIHLYDEYPYKTSWVDEPAPNLRRQLLDSGLTPAKADEILNNSVFTTLRQNVNEVHNNFALLRRELNQYRYPASGKISMGDSAYRYAGLWA
ncbi:MAG: hypothetical protein GEEBNDBF_01570 [bacterium]|nr:hypothetical protein [bacterium]